MVVIKVFCKIALLSCIQCSRTLFLKKGYFMRFFLIFSETVLCKALRFFELHSVQQDASFDISKTVFGHFFHILY